MKDYYENTRKCIDEYNFIQEKMTSSPHVTTEGEDEFIQNFCIYFAHALIKDTGFGQSSREELEKITDIVNDVIR